MPTVPPGQLAFPFYPAAAAGREYDHLAAWMNEVPWYDDERILESVLKRVPAGASSLLELCCGSGRLLAFLGRRRLWRTILGVDVSAAMVRLAADAIGDVPRARVLLGDWIDSIENTQPEFDVLVLKNALHLIPNAVSKLQQLQEVASPGARLILVETVSPNIHANCFVRGFFRHVDYASMKHHFFTEATLRKTLKAANWIPDVPAERVRQHIDVDEWVARKCSTARARHGIRMCLHGADRRVRRSMEFDPPDSPIPTRMLRLQVVLRCRIGIP